MEFVKDILKKELERQKILLKVEKDWDIQIRLNSNAIEIKLALLILNVSSKAVVEARNGTNK